MLIHRYQREAYQRARFEANYYAWCARKGFPLPGNDPVTGTKRSSFNRFHAAEGRAAYKALARFWLQEARAIRTELN